MEFHQHKALCTLTRKMPDFDKMVLFCIVCMKRFKWTIHMKYFWLKKCEKETGKVWSFKNIVKWIFFSDTGVFKSSTKTQNSSELTFMVEPMFYANTAFAMLQRYGKVSPLPLLKITTKSTYFLPAEKITMLWIELQTYKTQKTSKSYI